MAATGHPMTATYRRLRRFYDRLRYACNAGARLFTYASETERSEYWAPSLEVSFYPEGDQLARFGHVYPAHRAWDDYMAAAAAAGWPSGAGAQLDAGSWYVQTMDARLREALLALTRSGLRVTAFNTDIPRLSLRLADPADAVRQQAAIVRLLWRHHRRWILPRRTADDDAADTAPLALAARPFTLAAVLEMPLTPRRVLVPLIPPGEEGRGLALRTARALVELIEAGYPYDNASPWLRNQLTLDSFRKLERRYGRTGQDTDKGVR